MRASDKMDSCNIRAALQVLQTSTRAPQNLQTAAEVHSLVAVETDEHDIARIKTQCAAVKQAAAKLSLLPAKLVKRMARGVVLVAEPGPSGWRNADIAAFGELKLDQLCCANGWARGRRLWYRTRQRNSGRRPRLPHLIVVPRNQSQGSNCHSHAHVSSAPSRWRKC